MTSNHLPLSRKKGLMPGSAIYTGRFVESKPTMQVISFGSDSLVEKVYTDPAQIRSALDPDRINWVIVTGFSNPGLVTTIGQSFGLHPLLLEDILNAELMPKLDEGDDYFCLFLKSLTLSGQGKKMESSQVCLVLGQNWVLTFCETASEPILTVLEHLRQNKSRMRTRGAGFLFYLLTDSIVDQYYPIIDLVEDGISDLEEILLRNNAENLVPRILAKRKNQARFRRAVNPLLEEIRRIQKTDHHLVDEETRYYLKDVLEHLAQISVVAEGVRESINNLMELYLARNDLQMNEVMKRLTVVSTIFIPLTFLVGLWGMNFKYMPELDWPWGYGMAWLILGATGLFTVWYLKRRRWF